MTMNQNFALARTTGMVAECCSSEKNWTSACCLHLESWQFIHSWHAFVWEFLAKYWNWNRTIRHTHQIFPCV